MLEGFTDGFNEGSRDMVGILEGAADGFIEGMGESDGTNEGAGEIDGASGQMPNGLEVSDDPNADPSWMRTLS